MKNIKIMLVVFSTSLFLTLAYALSPDQLPQSIVEAIQVGNYSEIARHFNSNVELTILNKEDVYSKTQAELILRDFFNTHRPISFILQHEGVQAQSQFAMGQLSTDQGDFVVTFKVNLQNNQTIIKQLRIEIPQ